MKVKYQITTSKAVVGVDRPVSAHLRINVENLHKKLSRFKQLKFCQNIFFFQNNILNDTSNATDRVFAIISKPLKILK